MAAADPAGTASTSQGRRSGKIPLGSCLDGTAAESCPERHRRQTPGSEGRGTRGGRAKRSITRPSLVSTHSANPRLRGGRLLRPQAVAMAMGQSPRAAGQELEPRIAQQ